MRPSELTAYVVRDELEHLMRNYPERTGTIPVTESAFDDETTCVYYADEEGVPISFPGYAERDDIGEIVFKTPVCIVGMWVESFHQEFKEDDCIRDVLLRNSTLRHASVPFTHEVKTLLVRAQDQQDADRTPWGQIDLDKVDPYSGY